jgi:hypothetical protein
MSKHKAVFIAALSGVLLAGCGSRAPAAAENETVEAAPNAAESASPTGVEPGNVSDPSGADPVPPPDAVSHPEGYLPPVSGAEPGVESPPASKEPPPATEDEYMRNRQSGS